jgi:hypothetical protein
MAKVTITEIEHGSVAEVADVNATLTSWNTNSTDIDEENFRERSLDYRNLEKVFCVYGDTAESDAISGDVEQVTWTAFQEFTTPMDVGGFDVESGDSVVVRFSCGIRVEAIAGGAVTHPLIEVRLGVKTGSGGGAVGMANTDRRIDLAAVLPGVIIANPGEINTSLSVSAVRTATGNNQWFTVQVKRSASTDGALTYIQDAHLTAIQYKR